MKRYKLPLVQKRKRWTRFGIERYAKGAVNSINLNHMHILYTCLLNSEQYKSVAVVTATLRQGKVFLNGMYKSHKEITVVNCYAQM